jgi:type IV secretory pathway VirD2 relaxase
MIVRTCSIDGNHRYSWTKNQRSFVREQDPALHVTSQNDQLMSECRVLCFKPALRLEWRGQDGQDEAEQRKHCALTLGDSFS